MDNHNTGEKQISIVAKGLCKAYRMGDETVVALRNIDLSIARGEICCVFGASGSGKSTLLNMIAGMEQPSRGEVFLNGKEITKMSENQLASFRQKNVGFVFQSYNLLPMMTALENVELPLIFSGEDKHRRKTMAAGALKAVGLGDRLRHYPMQMSGGQQQRTGIARAFVAHPPIIFADEPTGNLDTKTTKEVMSMMVGFARKYNETMVLVTHNPELAQYADRIITLRDGEIVSQEKLREVKTK